MGALESSDCGLSLDPQAFGQAVASDCRAPFSFLGITQAWCLFQLPPPPLGLDLQQGVLTTGTPPGLSHWLWLAHLFLGLLLRFLVHPVELIQGIHEHRSYLVNQLFDLGECVSLCPRGRD